MFPKDFYTYLDKHNLIGVKTGKDREKFTKIWMVHINDRVFARSWYKNACLPVGRKEAGSLLFCKTKKVK